MVDISFHHGHLFCYFFLFKSFFASVCTFDYYYFCSTNVQGTNGKKIKNSETSDISNIYIAVLPLWQKLHGKNNDINVSNAENSEIERRISTKMKFIKNSITEMGLVIHVSMYHYVIYFFNIFLHHGYKLNWQEK